MSYEKPGLPGLPITIRQHWAGTYSETGHLIHEGAATAAATLLPAMADVEEHIRLQTGVFVEAGVRHLRHTLPAAFRLISWRSDYRKLCIACHCCVVGSKGRSAPSRALYF